MDVPISTALAEIYPEDALAAQTKRWHELVAAFKERYGRLPDFVARSPGRVNIIGEHIDYSLYEVLPMAVTADVLLAVAIHERESGPSTMRLTNVHPQKFEAREFDVPDTGDVHIDSSTLEWTNYFKSGLLGATELLRKKHDGFRASVGMDVFADGSVPSGGGLSSSAAFTCASALAVMRANGEKTVDKTELTELAIESERSVGVNSGGMDQSASVFPVQGTAVYVSFVPKLSVRQVAFPELQSPLVFVIAQSFVAADKHVTAPVCYNLRVVEVTLAALVLAKLNGIGPLQKDAGSLGVSLRGFHDQYMMRKKGITDNYSVCPEDFQQQLQEMIKLVDETLTQEEGYTREQLSEILGESISALEKQYMTKFPIRAERFKLRQRAHHVFAESLRVLKFMDLLSAPAPKDSAGNEKLLQSLGALMNETQDSSRNIYENSCPEVDELCQIARSAGSYGSRVTGAGWGGCTVHLVPKDAVENVKSSWISGYYRKHFPDISDERLAEAIIVSKPGSGSCVFEVNGREAF